MRIDWGAAKFYSDGVSNGVLYPGNSPGVGWSGLISVTEKADDASTPMYIDGRKYNNHTAQTPFSGTISAYTYPDEFERFNGVSGGFTAQTRPLFGLTYRDNREIHMVYNVLAAPSNDQYQSAGGDISPVAFSWDFTSIPVPVPTCKATSHLVISVDSADPEAVASLEDMLYGDDDDDPFLPTPEAVIELFESFTTLRITDNGDGTWTADGPDSAITMLDADTFQIDWPSAIFLSGDTYRIYSL